MLLQIIHMCLLLLAILPLVILLPVPSHINTTESTGRTTTTPTTTFKTNKDSNSGGPDESSKIVYILKIVSIILSSLSPFLATWIYSCCKYHKTIDLTSKLMETYETKYEIQRGRWYKTWTLCWDYNIFCSSFNCKHLFLDNCCLSKHCGNGSIEKNVPEQYVKNALKDQSEVQNTYKCEIYEKVPYKSDKEFLHVTNKYCAGIFNHSHYCVRKDCEKNDHEFYRKCGKCCLEPVIYHFVLDWKKDDYPNRIESRKQQLSSDKTKLVNHDDIPYMVLHNDTEVNEDVYQRELKLLNDSKKNISVCLLNFPTPDKLKDGEREAMKFIIDFLHQFKVRMLVRCDSNEGSNSSDEKKQNSRNGHESVGLTEFHSTPADICQETGTISQQEGEEALLLSSTKEVYGTSSLTTTTNQKLHQKNNTLKEQGFYTPVPDSFDEQDIGNSSLVDSTTGPQSSMQDYMSSSGEGMSSKVNNDDDVMDDEVTREIRRIKKLPLEDLPGKYEIQLELESGSVDTWIRSFPYTFKDKGIQFDLNIEHLVALHDAVNGGGNAALTFFAIFQIRKFDKEISYLRDILKKGEAKESFINAIKVLEKDEYNGAGKVIGNITSKDINELATQTSAVAADGSRIPQKTWEYIAGESDMQNVVKDCKLSRTGAGYERKSEMLFEIIKQGCPEYKIEDMLKVFETAGLRRIVNLVNKKIQEKAERTLGRNDQ